MYGIIPPLTTVPLTQLGTFFEIKYGIIDTMNSYLLIMLGTFFEIKYGIISETKILAL